jgi:ketosteroid isomerase-like protein
MFATPIQTVSAFIEAMNSGNIDAAVARYEPNGILIAQPGVLAVGITAIREALVGMLSMNPKLSTVTQEVIVSNDLALYHSEWTMNGTGPDGTQITLSGKSADVLRRQPNGDWKISIDNPWGTAVLSGNE